MVKSYKRVTLDHIHNTIDTIAARKNTDEQVRLILQVVNLVNEIGWGRFDSAEIQQEFKCDRVSVKVRWSKDNLITTKKG